MSLLRIAGTMLIFAASINGQIVTPFVSPTASICSISNCSVSASRGKAFGWEQRIVNTTIVAATVVTIVNTNANTSRVTTLFNSLPNGYTLPPMNLEGTVTQRITYTRFGQTLSTDLAFPSEFNAYVDAYTWNGTLATNSTSCLTAKSPSIGPLTTFPPQPSVAFPVYESGNTTITDDTKGLYFSPITDDIQLGDVARFYTEVVPIQECTLTVTSPVIPHWTAQFLTHTSTSFEAGDITTSSVAPDVSPPPPPGPPASPSPTPSTPVPNPPSPVPNLPSLSSSPGPVPEPNPQAPLPPSSSISKVQPLVEQTASQQALPDGSITPENPSQLPQSDQSTASATYVSGTSTPNDELPGISPLQTTSGSSSEAVITFTGVTDDVSFTNIYTSIIPVPTQLTTSDGRLVSPVYRVMGPLAVTIGLLLCI